MAGSTSPQKRIFDGVIIDARSSKRRNASPASGQASPTTTPPPAKRVRLEEYTSSNGSASRSGAVGASTRSLRSDGYASRDPHDAPSSSKSGSARSGGTSAPRQGTATKIDIPTRGASWDPARLSSPTTHAASPTRSSHRPSPAIASQPRVLGDRSPIPAGPSSLRASPTHRTPSRARDDDDDDEEEDELSIPVSGSRSSRRLPGRPGHAGTELEGNGKGKGRPPEERDGHRRDRGAPPSVLLKSGQKPPAFTLPGQRNSSRKKAAISDLLSRTTASSASTGLEDGLSAQTLGHAKSATSASDEAVSGSVQLPESPDQRAGTAATAEEGLAARVAQTRTSEDPSEQTASTLPSGRRSVQMDLDSEHPSATDSPLSTPSELENEFEALKLPAPLRDTSSNGEGGGAEPSLATPTKKAIPSRLSTPSASAKKRTPTKAAKASDAAQNGETRFADLLAPSGSGISQPTRTVSETGSFTIATRPREPRPERSYPKRDAIRILDRVLERLSGPCSTVQKSVAAPNPHEPAYRPWLAARACMSAGHEAAEKDVRNTLDRTVREGEGNCLLLVGERGIGKTAIVDRSLKTLTGVYGEDGMLVVRLSGLVQRDDKGALKEVARQLCSNAYVDDADAEGGSSFTSNANILSSLLAILEPGPTDDAEAGSAPSKPLIFIIDEFDLFAHHSIRQSFLYCLLDCVQGGFRRGGMAVLGLSARADCIETLEKRVKSRCQSRVHHLLPAEDVLAGVAKTAMEAMTLNTPDVASPIEEDWNAGVELFFTDKAVQVQISALDELRGLDADRKFFDDLAMLVGNVRHRIRSSPGEAVTTSSLVLQAEDLTPCIQLQERSVPEGLGMPEVAMLISAKHLVEEERPCNFVVAYERYTDHCKRAAASGASSSKAFSRGLCLKAFERLRLLGLIKDVAVTARGGSVGGGSIFRLCRLVPWSSMIEEAVKERKDIPQHLVKWSKAWSD